MLQYKVLCISELTAKYITNYMCNQIKSKYIQVKLISKVTT
jgi:hypothetical protein